MKTAVIGSRRLKITELEKYLPEDTTEIVSGGAKGIDACVAEYAENNGIPLKVFLPEYEKYGKSAPLKRNLLIIDYADTVIAFWDGISHGTRFVIDKCMEKGVPVTVIMVNN